MAPKKESQGALVLMTFKILGQELHLPISHRLFFPYISSYNLLYFLFCLYTFKISTPLERVWITKGVDHANGKYVTVHDKIEKHAKPQQMLPRRDKILE